MSEGGRVAVRDACRPADVVIQRMRDRAIAEGHLSLAATARSSDAEIERVWAEARVAGSVTPELEREHAELVALRRYARALELRWAAALESILARGRLAEARRTAERARREAGVPLERSSRTRLPTWRHDLARGGGA